jgi:hypothetical protein
VTANGVSGSVATSTTTPAITLTLGAITPSAVQISGLTASEIVLTDASKNLVSAAVATYPSLTELTYLKGVTSAIQTQFSGKVTGPASATDTAVAIYDGTTGKLIKNQTNILIDSNGRLRVGGADGSAMIDIIGATSVVQGLRIRGDAANALSFSTFVAADAQLRFVFQSDGTMLWGSGAAVSDTNLYRAGANSLQTDDLMTATLGFRPATNDGAALGAAGTAFSDLFLAEGAVINWDSGDATITQTGNVLAVSGADLQVATAGVGTNADSVPTISSTNTFTNKRITKRTGTTTSSATPTIDTDNVDYYSITAQTVDITSMSTNLSGTPTTAQQLRIDITGTAARAITWGASFANGPVALPTTTVTTTRLYVLLEYDGTIWRCMASGSTV